MFKVESSAEAKEIGIWDITHVESGRVVAKISTYRGFRRNIKQLKVHDKNVCEVRNQNEALEKLGEFFAEIKRDISELEAKVEILEDSKRALNHEYAIGVLDKEVQHLKKNIEELEAYNLV